MDKKVWLTEKTAKRLIASAEVTESLVPSTRANKKNKIFTRGNAYIQLTVDNDENNFDGVEVEYDLDLDPPAWSTISGGRSWGDGEGEVKLIVTEGAVDDIVKAQAITAKDGTIVWLGNSLVGGGGSLVYATSPNTTLDASYTIGATFDEPAGTGTALTAGVFYLSTPWNTRITAPAKMFAWWNKVSDNYYYNIDEFAVKPSANYSASAGAGITTFTAYKDKSETLSLGTNTAFPAGIKILLKDFDAANASTNSLAYFNGKTFDCKYDSANNIIYLDHPSF